MKYFEFFVNKFPETRHFDFSVRNILNQKKRKEKKYIQSVSLAIQEVNSKSSKQSGSIFKPPAPQKNTESVTGRYDLILANLLYENLALSK